jgi:hypothetical protein
MVVPSLNTAGSGSVVELWIVTEDPALRASEARAVMLLPEAVKSAWLTPLTNIE